MRRPLIVLSLALLAGCLDLKREPDPQAAGAVEPEVFDVIRASNSKAAVEQLRDRFEEEKEHARLLKARIDELASAEEALAQEQRERQAALQTVKDQLKKITDEQNALAQALAVQQAKRDELKKALDQAEQERKAAEAAAKHDGGR